MRKPFSFAITIAIFQLGSISLFAQLDTPDTSLLYSSIRNIVSVHNEVLADKIHLYNGAENESYNHAALGHPYFMVQTMQKGALFYDGIFYDNVPMIYDLQKDNVVTMVYNTDKSETERGAGLQIDLIRNRVFSFSVLGHQFVRLEADSNASKMKDGFYDKVYDGKLKLFIKRTKLYIEAVRNTDLEVRFDQIDFYYIQQGGIYHAIKSKKSLLNLFSDKRKELAKYIKKKKLKYKVDPEELITAVTRYYDQLKD